MKKKKILYPVCNKCQETSRPIRFVLQDLGAEDSEKELKFCTSSCAAEHLSDQAGCVHGWPCYCFERGYHY